MIEQIIFQKILACQRMYILHIQFQHKKKHIKTDIRLAHIKQNKKKHLTIYNPVPNRDKKEKK